MQSISTAISIITFAIAMGVPSALHASQLSEDIENGVSGPGQKIVAARLIDDAIPQGTPLRAAETSLRRLGASCRQRHADPNIEKCEYDGPTMFEGDRIESVYWTIELNLEGGRVANIVVQRKQDLH